MNIYFSTSGDLYKKDRKTYDNIINVLAKLTGKKPYVALGDIDYEKSNENDIIDAVKKMEKQLKVSDIIIVENTYSVMGVGYDVAKGLDMKKPVLILNQEGKDKLGPHPVKTLGNKLLKYKSYNEENLEETVKKFLDFAKKKLDTKFILIISPDIDQYLEWSADSKRMHKAQIVRNAVEDQMAKDKEWKAYISQ